MVKTFWDIDGNKLTFNTKKVLGVGDYGTVYELEDDDEKCLKEFDMTLKNNIVDMDVSREISSRDFDMVIKVYQVLYGDYRPDVSDYWKSRSEMIKGELLKKYNKDIKNILESPTDYLLANISDLMKLMETFAKMHININDSHAGNFILTNDRMVIIDIDSYFRDYSSLVYDKNMGYICCGLYDLFKKSLCENYELSAAERLAMLGVIKDLFYGDREIVTFKNGFCGEGLPEVKDKIKTYRKPIDYIRASVNR